MLNLQTDLWRLLRKYMNGTQVIHLHLCLNVNALFRTQQLCIICMGKSLPCSISCLWCQLLFLCVRTLLQLCLVVVLTRICWACTKSMWRVCLAPSAVCDASCYFCVLELCYSCVLWLCWPELAGPVPRVCGEFAWLHQLSVMPAAISVC